MKPTLGRIVIYNTTKGDRAKMLVPREQLPAIIVWVDPTPVPGKEEEVNVKIFMEGSGDMTWQSVPRGDGAGQWNWPSREEDKTEVGPKVQLDNRPHLEKPVEEVKVVVPVSATGAPLEVALAAGEIKVDTPPVVVPADKPKNWDPKKGWGD